MAKRLRIPKGYSKVVNQRTGNKMAKHLKIPKGQSEAGNCRTYNSSESGPNSAIDPYVKPCFPPDPPEMTALTGTPVSIDNEVFQTE